MPQFTFWIVNHKLPKIDLIKYHHKSLPVSSRAALPGHRQCLHLCFSCKEYVYCFVLFCFVPLLYFASLCDIGSCCEELMSRMAVVVYAGKHQRRDPEQRLTFKSIKKPFYPFSSSESTLAPLRRRRVSSSWHPELGGALGPKVYISFGGKGKTSEPIFVQRNCFKIQDCQKHPAGDPPCGKV